jgi:hypothetical protein
MTTILQTLPALNTTTQAGITVNGLKTADRSMGLKHQDDGPGAEIQVTDHGRRNTIRIIRTSISEGEPMASKTESAIGANAAAEAMSLTKIQILGQSGAGVFRQVPHDPQAILNLLR